MRFLTVAAMVVAFSAAAAPRAEVRVAVDDLPGNPFGEIVRIPGTERGANCLAYDAKARLLYVGGDHRVLVYDAADPLRPRLQGEAKGIGRPRQMAVQNGMVYVAARETGLWIVDAKDPSAPKVVSRFDSVELATGIDVCYPVVFLGQRHYGVEFIDVSDPRRPEHVRVQKTGESQSVVYRDGIVYSGDWGVGEVTTIDAHDLSAVRTVNIARLKGHGDGLDVQGDRLYASTGHHYHDKSRPMEENRGRGHGLEIFDVSDPRAPKFVSRVQFPRFYSIGNDFWTPRASGTTVFCSDTFNGVFAVDVSDERNPKVIGRIQASTPSAPFKDPDGNLIANSPVQEIALGEGALYVAVPAGGAYAVACGRAKPSARMRGRPPAGVKFRQDYPTASKRFTAWRPSCRALVRGVTAYGDTVYAACALGGLAILRDDGRGGLRQVGSLGSGFVGDAKVVGTRLYTAEGFEGVAVYDLAVDPLKPAEIGRCTCFGSPVDCALWVWAPADGLIVCSNRENGYFFLDAHDLKDMKVLLRSPGCPGWDRYLADRAVGGRWVAQSLANVGFKWIDVSGGQAKVALQSRRNKGGISDGCCRFRSDRLLRMMDGGIAYLKPGQGENPDGTPWKPTAFVRNGSERMSGGQPVWDGGNLLALTRRTAKEVAVADIADETNPRLLWKETVLGDPDASCWWKGRLLVPCGYQGLLITRK